MSWASVRKHWGCPENCVKTNGSPGTGSTSGENVFRENVNTNSAAAGRATRAASPTARRNSAPDRARFQMPWAITRSQVRSPMGTRSMGASVRCTRPATCSCRARLEAATSMGHDRSVPMTSHPSSAIGTAFRPAPHPRSIARPSRTRASSRVANPMRTWFGGECAKPATVAGALHDDPASGSTNLTIDDSSWRSTLIPATRRPTRRQVGRRTWRRVVEQAISAARGSGLEVERHARDDRVRLEEQRALDQQRALIVKQMVPPARRHELRQHHRDVVVRTLRVDTARCTRAAAPSASDTATRGRPAARPRPMSAHCALELLGRGRIDVRRTPRARRATASSRSRAPRRRRAGCR